MKAFQPQPAAPPSLHDMDQTALILLGLLGLCAAAYMILQHQQYPRGYSYHNYRMDLDGGGRDSYGVRVPEALYKLFSNYG